MIGLIVLTALSMGCVQEETGETVSAEVIRIVDGDTIEVKIDGEEETVRILGIDTPEVHTDVEPEEWEGISNESWLRKYGHKASNFTRRWLTTDEEIELTYDSNEGKRGSYGRLLAYVGLKNGTDLGAELIENGMARVYDEGDCVREDEYLSLEQDARSERIGVWGTSD